MSMAVQAVALQTGLSGVLELLKNNIQSSFGLLGGASTGGALGLPPLSLGVGHQLDITG